MIFNAGDETDGCLPGGTSYTSWQTGNIFFTTFDNYYDRECNFASSTSTALVNTNIVAGETYTMYLHFSEIYFGAGNVAPSQGNGARVFHVDVEGQRILEYFDIHSLAGPRTSLVFRYDVTASVDGQINMNFIPVIDRPKISAIELHDLGESSQLPSLLGYIDVTGGTFPVEWNDISIEAEGEAATIKWSTVWESNNQGFEVQVKDQDGRFETLGFVDGAGTTQDVQNYSFTTNTLNPGKYFFRLKQVDFDGNYSLSPVVELTMNNSTGAAYLTAAPNPTSDFMSIQVQTAGNDDVTLTLRNLMGQEIRPIFAGQTDAQGFLQQSVDLSTLTPGIYLIHLQTRHSSEAIRVMKTN